MTQNLKSSRPGPPQKTPLTQGIGATDWKDTADERRIKDVAAARSVFIRLQTDNELRFATFRNTRNQLEGGRPYNPQDMETQGATWQTNVNFGDARASRDRTLLPYWKLVHDVPHTIAVTVDTSGQDAGKSEAAFAECFDLFLKDWGADYFVQFMNKASNFVNFGPGIVQWAELDNPRWKAVNVQRVVWPKNARMSPDEWDVVALVQDCAPTDLYQKLRTAKARKTHEAAGWNIDAVQKAIQYFKDGTFSPDPRDYTRWQDMFVNNDIAVATPFEPLQLVWLFVRQFADDDGTPGKVGCYVFTQQGGVEEFLFEDEDYCDKFQETLNAVWYDTGVDSMVHSIKGFAIKNFYFTALLNRVKSRFVDAATFGFGINFQRNDSIPDEAPPIENYGPVTIFPPGLSQLNVYPQVQQSATVIEMLENNQAQNNSQYREQTQQIQETDTATQAKLLAAMQGELSEASASIYLAQVGENIFAQCMAKLRKRENRNPDAVAFVKRMRMRGIPDAAIFDADIRVQCGANAGMASAANRALKFQQLLPLMNAPGVNGRYILSEYFTSVLGSMGGVKALVPEGETENPLQVRQALMENQDFGQGQALPVAPSDNHAVHAATHITPLEGIVGAYQQQGTINPEQTVALTIGTEHTGQHMQALATDESQKAVFQQLNPRFRMIQSAARGILTKLSQNAQGQQSGAPGQPQQQPQGNVVPMQQ